MNYSLSEKIFRELLALMASEELPAETKRILSEYNFDYRPIPSGAERDEVILDVLKRIHDSTLRPSGESRQDDWERGWGENLRDFVESGYNVEALIPKYFKPNPVLRLQGEFVRPVESRFELNFIKALRSFVTDRYLSSSPHVFEFGCGTGYHLVSLAKQLPDAKICGLDWAQATVETIDLLSKHLDTSIQGRRFDYFNPDYSLDVPAKSAFFTFASLEQVGVEHRKFFDFILHKRPAICVHVECCDSLYDPSGLMDFLALTYHRKRNYLSHFLERLRELEAQGKAVVERVQRTNIGNAYHEAYTLLVWRPI